MLKSVERLATSVGRWGAIPLAVACTVASMQAEPVERKALQRPRSLLEQEHSGLKIRFVEKDLRYTVSTADEDEESIVHFYPGWFVDVVIEGKVAKTGAGENYRYDYEVRNLKTSRQGVWRFLVDYESSVEVSETPVGWRGRILDWRPSVSWRLPRLGGLEAGGRQAGFSIETGREAVVAPQSQPTAEKRSAAAATLPGMVTCHVSGNSKAQVGGEGVSRSVRRVIPNPARLEDNVFGKTIGPVAVPREDVERQLLDRLEGYLPEMTDLGWISDRSWLEATAKGLEGIERLVAEGSRAEAGKEIGRLLERVERGAADGILSTEAHGILLYNLEYVTRRLQG